jgi:hypothetical protein
MHRDFTFTFTLTYRFDGVEYMKTNMAYFQIPFIILTGRKEEHNEITQYYRPLGREPNPG